MLKLPRLACVAVIVMGCAAPVSAAQDNGEFAPPDKGNGNVLEPESAKPASARENEPAPLPTAEGDKLPVPQVAGIFLSLEDCVEIAVQNNLGLRISRLRDRSTDIAVRVAWSRYLPEFDASFDHSNSRAVGEDAPKGTNTFNGGITQRSPWGTTLDFSLSETRSSLDTDSATGDLDVRVTQPLWRGMGPDVGMNEIRRERIRRIISRGTLELETQTLIFQVRQSYANIIRVSQNLQVSRQSVRSSKTFLDLTRARYDAGQVTKLDVFNAEVLLKRRELDVISGERALESDYDRLKQIMDVDLAEHVVVDVPVIDFGEQSEEGVVKELRPDEPSGSVTLVVTRNNEVIQQNLLYQATRFDEKLVLSEAFENRVDLLNSRRSVALQKLNTLLAKNGLGHQIDLTGGFNRSHSGRSIVERDNGTERNDWDIGLNYSAQWGKVRDRAAYENALLALSESEIELKQARTTVQLEVRNIMRTLREFEKAMLIESERVEQAKRSVEAAKERFARGLNDSFEVIRAEDDLLAAKNDFISRKMLYVIELARLEVVVGKPTGRVDLSGQSVGGLIDSRLPEDMREKPMPAAQPDAEPRPEDDPKSKIPSYRKDYHPKKCQTIRRDGEGNVLPTVRE